MTNHVAGKSIVITGAGSGFGKLVAQRVAAMGAQVVCADIGGDAAEAVAAGIRAAGGSASAFRADVADAGAMRALATSAVDAFGAIDVMVNNAGVMPLAFYSDHAAALDAWHRCIDVNFKGVLNGIVAVYDQMIAQGRGHVVNLSSIYGNFPVVGAAVYGATKAAVNFLSESLRVESRGKIKVTIVKPTGVPATNLASSVINQAAIVGIVGQNMPELMDLFGRMAHGTLPDALDPERIDYPSLAPEFIADAIVHAIDQPWGVSIGDVTVRAAGDHFIL
jgi:NADP-dependent 3-hydroxy acid dehydrogenase YdfG